MFVRGFQFFLHKISSFSCLCVETMVLPAVMTKADNIYDICKDSNTKQGRVCNPWVNVMELVMEDSNTKQGRVCNPSQSQILNAKRDCKEGKGRATNPSLLGGVNRGRVINPSLLLVDLGGIICLVGRPRVFCAIVVVGAHLIVVLKSSLLIVWG